MAMAAKTAAADGTAIMALQKAEQAAGAVPCSSPAQPLHLPGIGMSPDMGMSVVAVTADLTTVCGPAKPCAASPTAKTRAASNVDIRRILRDSIHRQ